MMPGAPAWATLRSKSSPADASVAVAAYPPSPPAADSTPPPCAPYGTVNVCWPHVSYLAVPITSACAVAAIAASSIAASAVARPPVLSIPPVVRIRASSGAVVITARQARRKGAPRTLGTLRICRAVRPLRVRDRGLNGVRALHLRERQRDRAEHLRAGPQRRREHAGGVRRRLDREARD